MKIITMIIATGLIISSAIPSYADDAYAAFYNDAARCDLLAKAGFDAYRMFGESHGLLVSYNGDDKKCDAFFEKKLLELMEIPYIKSNRGLFTYSVLRQLMREAIPIWEHYGDEYLANSIKDYNSRYSTCMNYNNLKEGRGIMAIADRCKCGKTRLDNPKSIKENPFYMNCKTGEIMCQDCYVMEVSVRDSVADWVFVSGYAKQRSVLVKIKSANDWFTGMRNKIGWAPLNVFLCKLQTGFLKKVEILSARFSIFRYRAVWGRK